MIPYVYVLGMSHSGSTLLAFLLNTHPEIISVGETVRITEILPDRWFRKVDLCSCGKTYYEDEFWNRVLAGFAARGFGIGEPDFYQYKPSEKKVADLKLKALIEAFLEVSGEKVYLDASKDAFAIRPLVSNPYLDFKVIDLYRDGRGVLHSWSKRLHDLSYRKLIKEWIAREKKRHAALRSLSANSVLKVKYEDLCRNTDAELRRIFQFMGVTPIHNGISGYKSEIEHHIIGNQMRLDSNESIKLDEKWRLGWDDEKARLFRKFGGEKQNLYNGYSD